MNYPYIVAEIGLAHEGSVELAERLIDEACKTGCDAVKMQAYRTSELINRNRDKHGMFDRFKRKELPYSAFPKLKHCAENQGVVWFATPHTVSALEMLMGLNVPVIKIGSGEKGCRTIIDRAWQWAAEKHKEIFISTGMRNHLEVVEMVERYGGPHAAFLHCISQYPASPQSLNLDFLTVMKSWCEARKSVVGYSDHFQGSYACELAIAMGAKIIEKHIRLEESTGQDIHGALFPIEFTQMVKKIRYVELLKGDSIRNYDDRERETEVWALKGKDGKRPR